MSSHPSSKPRVAVVFGGRSSEHAVSCATAAGVLRAIDRDAYDAVAWMLQELRVSLFAQDVGTPGPVSEQRITKALAKLT